MPLTTLEADLRVQIRKLIESGELPCVVPSRMWGGNGSGQVCSVCAKPIGVNELEFEYPIGPKTLLFHRLCHGLWQLECERAAALSKSPSTPHPADKQT
jgi:hypothetical protein